MEEIQASMQRMSQMEESTGELEEVRNEVVGAVEVLAEIAKNNLESTKQTYQQTEEVADTFAKLNTSAEELRMISEKLVNSIRYFHVD